MFVIKDSIHVIAPIERCFLLSTNIDLAARTIGMRAVAGSASGLVKAGDRVVWRGWKFGFPRRHESIISAYDAPSFFRDFMASGSFRFFQHDHELTEICGQVLLNDVIRFALPFGVAGRLVAKYIMVPHIRRLLQRRLTLLKLVAESDGWRGYLPEELPGGCIGIRDRCFPGLDKPDSRRRAAERVGDGPKGILQGLKPHS